MSWFTRKRRLTAELAADEETLRQPVPVDRLLVFFLLLVAASLILSQALLDEPPLPRVGQVAERDIYAPRGFVYHDQVSAREAIERKMQSLPAPYALDLEGFAAVGESLRAQAAALAPDSSGPGRARRDKLLRAVDLLIRAVADSGLLPHTQPPERLLALKRGDTVSFVAVAAVVTPGNWSRFLAGVAPEDAASLALVLDRTLRPTLRYDQERAAQLAAELENQIPAPTRVFPSEVPVIVAGQEITERDVDLLAQLQRYRTRSHLVQVTALIAFLAMTMIFGTVYLSRYLPNIFNRFRDVVAISFSFGVVLLLCLLTKLIIDRVDISGFRFTNSALPVAAAAMVLALIYSTRMAFIFSLFLSVLVAVVIAPRLSLLVMFFFGSMTAALTTVNSRKRSDLFRAGIWIALVQSAVVITIGFMLGEPLRAMRIDILSAVFSGFLSSLLVPLILLPVEAISRRTSNFRLLELTDLNHHLLQMMLRKAPGTFQHSQHVALLAQSAAEAIGANSLLTRVGAYFHDIGKIRKPEYFTENQAGGDNPHDRLKPSLSASIVRSHVTDGRALAEENALPDAVVDFIAQHHGTAGMNVFYHRALEAAGEGDTVVKSEYQYPGPRPQSPETAIVMLADAVEAATRSLEKPTTTKLEKSVRRIITDKFESGELDECELTLKDLTTIADAFAHVLAAMYHTRNIEYPEADEIAEAERRNKGER